VRVDAHQHYWRFDAVRDSWITPELGVLRRDFLPADAEPLLRAARIDAVVAVQADQSVTETEFLLSLAERHDFIRGVVGWIDLRAPDLADQLDTWRGRERLKGFRHVAQAEADDFLSRPEIVAGVALLGERNYTYDVLVYPRQLAAAARLVEQCAGVRFILDHCAKPPIANGDMAPWRDGFERLASFPNVACKLSGLVTEARWQAWTDADLRPVLDAALDAFGPERLMFASDWPVCSLAAEYHRVVDTVSEWSRQLTAAERGQVLGGTAQRVYGLR
jgi:L-fuconolactonase